MPPLPIDAGGRTALVLGGNGITGTYLIEHLLLKTPESEWKKIIAVSRKLPSVEWLRFDLGLTDCQVDDVMNGRGRLTWIGADLLEESLESLISKFRLGGVSDVTNIFWAAYIPVDGVGMPKERAANAKIYEQGVRAAVTLCRDNLRRVLLQTGAKLYGVHRRSIPMPLEETMPPHEVGADFYLDQLASTRQLIKECNNSFDYVMTVPGAICGFTRSSYQSLATSLGLYIALKAHLREPAEFPSTRHKYQTGEDMCCASLLAEFDVWCGVTPKCGGETFNVQNSSFFNWRTLYPRLLKHFGALPPTRLGAAMDQGGVYSIAKDIAPRANQVWAEMCKKYKGLDPKAITYATWEFLDFCFEGNQMVILSFVKARKFGFCGVRQTDEMFLEIFARMRRAGALPPVPADEARL